MDSDSLTLEGAERLAKRIEGFWAGYGWKVELKLVPGKARLRQDKLEQLYYIRSDMKNGHPIARMPDLKVA